MLKKRTGVPHHSHIESLDFRIVNCFIYGVDSTGTFANQPDVHAPLRAEERIPQLCGRFTSGLWNPPTLISLHSGLWDLAAFGRMDGATAGTTPLSQAQTQYWLDRMDVIIASIRATWPGIPIHLRTSHRVGDQGASVDYAMPGTEKPRFFSDQRSAQVRELQLTVAKRYCLMVNDFATVWEGHQRQQDKVRFFFLPLRRRY